MFGLIGMLITLVVGFLFLLAVISIIGSFLSIFDKDKNKN